MSRQTKTISAGLLIVLLASLFIARSFPHSGLAGGNAVIFVWSGAVTSESVTVKARLASDSTTVRLLVSSQPDLSTPMLSDFYTATVTTNRVVSIPMSGLSPDTQYHYAIEADGTVFTNMQGKFHTFPDGPASFTFAMSGDANTGSDHPVFGTILDQNPLFFFHLGDMYYEDITVNDVSLYRAAFDTVLASPGQSALYRNVSFAYIWDDHDYGPNNSDSTSPGRQAARLSYQEYVPHYPLAAGSGDVPIYQAFAVGRVWFIVTDTRSERTPNSAPDDASKTMLGSAQKAWFKQQLLDANGVYPIIVWVNSVPWINTPTPGSDSWGGFTTERAELANFIADNDIQGLFILSADAHILAIDDGTNSDYSTSGNAAIPLMHAAALDRSGIVLGGPYSEGVFPGPGQFGLMTITDDGGDTVCMNWSGRHIDLGELISWSTCVQADPVYQFIFLPLAVR
jgi:phosphodiesterase/alkaline phosphatase D-like protein